MKLSRSFITAMAFLCGAGFVALVLLGSGIASTLMNTDDPFSFGVYSTGVGPIVTALTLPCFSLAAWRAGRAFTGRIRFWSLIGIAVTTFFAGLVIQIIVVILLSSQTAGSWVFAVVAFVIQPPGLIVASAAFIAGWAYLGTLRWQMRNAETKQFAPVQD